MTTNTGNRGLDLNEGLIFEKAEDHCGVDFSDLDPTDSKASPSPLAKNLLRDNLDLPGLSEPETIRHYTRLSRMNYAIDMGLFPLGSCTMKHNPRLNEKLARIPGFADLHPLAPANAIQGALEIMVRLEDWLKALTGMPGISLSPKAGAHGELCGLMVIRKAHSVRGQDHRRIVLCPRSAHGTNPATAAFCGYDVVELAVNAKGRVELAELKENLNDNVAALMLTNPNTCGLFEPNMARMAQAVHEAGAYLYCDGANFNAIVGKVRLGDMGVDALHLNLHKSFSTPHGGGGPGSGPVVFSERLTPFLPYPMIRRDENNRLALVESPNCGKTEDEDHHLGRITAFQGQMGMFVRALAFIISHGSDGLRQATEDAVLNANYILSSLKDIMSPAFDGRCMHEALFDDHFLKGTNVTTLDFAKAMIDEGFHPMTVYFPLIVSGAMLIEPTESESLADLDQFTECLRSLAKAAQAGDLDRFSTAPHYAPVRRIDETRAARNVKLGYDQE